MNGPMSDMLAMAQALARSKEADDALKQALEKLTDNVSEQNSALADAVAALEKAGESRQSIDYDALARSLAAAMVAGLRGMPTPTITLPAKAGSDWTEMHLIPKRDARGAAETYVLKRVK